MKISKLILHNFGIYANTNELALSSEKPVVLIGGMNGRGKTTFLEAILLALYGRRSFAFAESKLSFPNYLTYLVNKSDGSFETHIELVFELTSGEELDIYRVRREWTLHNATPSFKTAVHKNSTYDQTLSDNWDLFVEEILPSAIAPFFFFDGEKISELADSNNDLLMKNSIKSLLGIDVIDLAIADIRKIIGNKKHEIKANSHAHEIAVFEDSISNAYEAAKKAADVLATLNGKRVKLLDTLQKADNDYSAIGGNLASNRKELLIKQATLQARLDDVNSRILEKVSGDLPLLRVLPLLQNIQSISESEKEQKAIHSALEQLPSLYKEFRKGQNSELGFDEFISFLKDNTKDISTVYDLSENNFFRLKSLCTTLNTQLRTDITSLLEQRNALLDDLGKTENYLTVSIDEAEVNNKYNEIISLTSKLATVTEQHQQATDAYSEKNAVYEDLQRKQLKVIEKVVGNLEGATDNERIVTYSGYCLDVLGSYKIQLQKAKTKTLAKTMTSCFKQIATKKNLISEIQIVPESLDFIYLGSDRNPISKSSFSAGENQLLVIAMLWALGICSKKQFPVIIDTPLARLDSAHRKTLITNYFPKASEQTILLSTDSEIHGKYYSMIQPYVEKEFTLSYSDETKQTVVVEGYFQSEEKL